MLQVSRGIEVSNAKCERTTFVIFATLCIMTHLFDLLLVMIMAEEFRNGDLVSDIWSSPIMLTRNIVSTIAAMIMSFFSVYYTVKLISLLKQTSIKAKVRTKVLLQSIVIQSVLLLRTVYVWVVLLVANIDNIQWLWPLFMFTFEFLAEILPFTIFCYLLLK